MDSLFYGFAALMAVFLLIAIAEPYRFMPEGKRKKKMVGSTYWGIYEGAAVTDADTGVTVEVPQPARKLRYTAGSSTYSKGRGVNMSGRG